jgi:hypothetical protein
MHHVTSSPRRLRVCALSGALLCALLGAVTQASAVTETFQSYSPGSFPAPAWQDFASFFPPQSNYPPAVLPSTTVVQTTDAFGNPTQAAQSADAPAGAGTGLWAYQTTGGTVMSIAADVRTLRFANANPVPANPDFGFTNSIGFWTANLASAPFLTLGTNSTTHRWGLSYGGDAPFANPNSDDYDLGGTALQGVWYHASLDFDRQVGSFHARVVDIASGGVVVDQVIFKSNWTPGLDDFNAVFLSTGEPSATLPPLPGAPNISNIGQFDNINYAAVPEPQAVLLMVLGLGVLRLSRGRREM